MLQPSFFDLRSAYVRALTASGIDFGIVEDAANMVIELDINSMNGVGLLMTALSENKQYETIRGLNNFNFEIDSSSTLVVDVGSRSILEVGPLLLDYFLADRIANDRKTLVINNVSDVELSAGLARLASNRGESLDLHWKEAELHKLACVRRGDSSILVTSNTVSGNDNQLEGKSVKIELLDDETENKMKCVKATNVASEHVLKPNEFSPLRKLSINAVLWRKLNDMGLNALVPDTYQSRTSGAGLGADSE